MRPRADFVPPVHEGYSGRDRLKVENPVECGVPAADDKQSFVAKRFHLSNSVYDTMPFVVLDAGNRRSLGLKRSSTGGNNYSPGVDYELIVRRNAEPWGFTCTENLKVHDGLVEVERCLKRFDLL